MVKKPPVDNYEKLIADPYQVFAGVDYRKIMSLNIEAIKIDTRNE